MLRACTDAPASVLWPHLRTLSPPSCPHNTGLLPAPLANSALRVEARPSLPIHLKPYLVAGVEEAEPWDLRAGLRAPGCTPLHGGCTGLQPRFRLWHWVPGVGPISYRPAGQEGRSAASQGTSAGSRLRPGCLPAALRTAARCLPRCFWLQSPHTQACIPPPYPPSLPLCLKSHLLPGLGSSGGWALSD